MELIISNYANGGLEVEALGGRACICMYMYITSEGQERKKYIHRMECGQGAEGGGGKHRITKMGKGISVFLNVKCFSITNHLYVSI